MVMYNFEKCIFYKNPLKSLFLVRKTECFTEKGLQFMDLICNEPDKVQTYIYSFIKGDRNLKNNITAELQQMRTDGIIFYKTIPNWCESKNELSIVFPIQVGKNYEGMLD